VHRKLEANSRDEAKYAQGSGKIVILDPLFVRNPDIVDLKLDDFETRP